jgi:hypothetical protein
MKYGKFIEVLKNNREDRIIEQLLFVAVAISTIETRYFMTVALFEDNQLIATDGLRMHILKDKDNRLKDIGFESGKTYKFLKATKRLIWFAECDIGGSFPKYKEAIPKDEPDKVFNYTAYSSLSCYTEMAKFFRNLYPEDVMNLSYLNDLPKDNTYEVKMYGPHKPVRLDCDDLTALIMPIKN